MTKTCPHPAEAAVWLVFFGLLSIGFWYTLSTTLDDLTLRDCKAGITKACNALNK